MKTLLNRNSEDKNSEDKNSRSKELENKNSADKASRVAFRAARLLLATLACYSLTAATVLAKPARQADKLVEAAGINTHFGYENTAYFGLEYNNRPVQDILKDRLIELGVRHIRDNLQGGGHHYGFLNELAGIRTPQQPNGIKTIAIARDWKNYPIDHIVTTEVAEAARLFNQSNQPLEAFEVRNEQDSYEEDQLAARIVLLQKAFYEAVKAQPGMQNLPVLGPSFAQTRGWPVAVDSPILAEAAATGIKLSNYIDIANLHSYSGVLNDTAHICPPEQLCAFFSRPYRHADAIEDYRRLSGSKPVYTTETGYSLDWPAEQLDKIEKDQQLAEADVARMVPRTLADSFDKGIQRVYFYQLADHEENFHFLNSDYSPRQQFIALRNTLRLLNDPGRDFEPDELDYRLSGDTRGVRELLLQKRDGTFYLLLWQAVGRAANDRGGYVGRKSLTLSLEDRQFASINLYEPTFATEANSPKRKAEVLNSRQTRVTVPDHLVVVEMILE